jgi:hypothetical protein
MERNRGGTNRRESREALLYNHVKWINLWSKQREIKNKVKYSQILIQHPSIHCHPHTAPKKASEQKFLTEFQGNHPVKGRLC